MFIRAFAETGPLAQLVIERKEANQNAVQRSRTDVPLYTGDKVGPLEPLNYRITNLPPVYKTLPINTVFSGIKFLSPLVPDIRLVPIHNDVDMSKINSVGQKYGINNNLSGIDEPTTGSGQNNTCLTNTVRSTCLTFNDILNLAPIPDCDSLAAAEQICDLSSSHISEDNIGYTQAEVVSHLDEEIVRRGLSSTQSQQVKAVLRNHIANYPAERYTTFLVNHIINTVAEPPLPTVPVSTVVTQPITQTQATQTQADNIEE